MGELAGYRLVELLGQGGGGAVWRAEAPGRGHREVAIKRVRPASPASAVKRLRAEADTLSELDHPHIVTVLDVIEVDANSDVDVGAEVAIVMVLARGGSLRALLDEQQRLAPGEVVALFSSVADAVGSAHRRGVVHGDLKPENVLLTIDGEPLVADFGAARHLSSGSIEERVGTPEYLDPRVTGGAEADPMADIYAIAVMASEALTGQRPEGGPRTSMLRSDASIPPALAEVIDAAMSDGIEQRPGSAEELRFALRSSVPGDRIRLPGPARHPVPSAGIIEGRSATRRFGPRPPVSAISVRRGRRPLAVALGAVAMLAIATGGWWWSAGGQPAERPRETATRGSTPRRPCPDGVELAVEPDEEVLRGDLAGDGCSMEVSWDGSTARVRLDSSAEVVSITFSDDAGRPLHGQLLLGDWNGDGTDSPAFYLPGTGEVVMFDRLAGEGEEVRRVARPTGVRSGIARVAPGGEGSDTVEVTPSG